MRAVILEHGEIEGPGHLGAALLAAGVTLDVRRSWRGEPAPESLDGVDAVIALGGPMDVTDDAGHPYLKREAELLAESARSGRLTLGICLGAQLFARGLGARVYRGPAPELGFFPLRVNALGMADPLLSTCADQSVFQWHAWTFDVPEGAQLLASTALYPHQAFAIGKRGYAIQFHPECDLDMRREWAQSSEPFLRGAGVNPASLSAPETTAVDRHGRIFAAALLKLL